LNNFYLMETPISLSALQKGEADQGMAEEVMPSVKSVADRYFKDLAESRPIISASDEFYFFPHLPMEMTDAGRLVETLDPDEIGDLVSRLKGYLRLLDQISPEGLYAEEEIDLALLRGSISGAVRELSDSPEDYPVWLRDPSFPLTILMESLSRIEGRAENYKDEDGLETALRLVTEGRALIKSAAGNLGGMKRRPERSTLSVVAVDAARKMVGDCIDFIRGPYLNRIEVFGGARGADIEIGREAAGLIDALREYRGSLDGIGLGEQFSPGADYLSRVLRESYGEGRSVDEIEEIGREEFRREIERLNEIGRMASGGSKGGWRDAYESFFPPNFSPDDLIGTYTSAVERIRGHLDGSGEVDPGWAGELAIDEVPTYLRSVRSAAAYSAPPPVGGDGIVKPEKPGVFYIIPSFPGGGEGDAGELKKSHREFIFMTAHETYPGHHLLDGVRTSLKNRIRSRIESPLFYEGWACYSETLLLDSGYLRDTEHEAGLALQLLRREAWRWARLLIDIGFNKFEMTIDGAAALLEGVGRPKRRAEMEALRIAMTPGYQLTYALGKYEFLRLREKYMESLGAKRFHRTVLFGGEIPFLYVEGRLKAEMDRVPDQG